MSTTAPVIDRLRARIGKDGASTQATVEAGHLQRFVEAIGDPNPRWISEAPPTFLVALAPASVHLAEAEEYGKGWLNGGNRFEYFEPVKVGDRINATGRVASYQPTPPTMPRTPATTQASLWGRAMPCRGTSAAPAGSARYSCRTTRASPMD